MITMIPATARERYITGLSALSVPFDGILADWRFGSALSGKKDLSITGATMPSTAHLWGLHEIEDQGDYFRGAGINVVGPVYVAPPARAIADLLYKLLSHRQDPACICVDHIHMSDAQKKRLSEMIRILADRMPSPELRAWMERQPTLQHLTSADGLNPFRREHREVLGTDVSADAI